MQQSSLLDSPPFLCNFKIATRPKLLNWEIIPESHDKKNKHRYRARGVSFLGSPIGLEPKKPRL